MSAETFDERAAFEAFVLSEGKETRYVQRQLAEELTEDGDCWTAAWRVAQELGGRYVEGTCWTPTHRIRAHAWVEVDVPPGTVVVECTEGYDGVVRYWGMPVSTSGRAAEATKNWPADMRGSVIEAAILAGLSPQKIKEFIA